MKTKRIEKLGEFYLGREYDLKNNSNTSMEVLYNSRDLTTHAVCVGMTGSGKTGLCIGLLEEAALDNVPAIIIDPKGDIANLLLTFPNLLPSDFKPWVNLDEATRKNLTLDEYSKYIAKKWQNGLIEWNQTAERIQFLKDSTDFSIYTPGSDSGKSISILSTLNPPNLNWNTAAELLRDQIGGVVRALLNLIKIDDNPLNKEYILLSSIIEFFWKKEKEINLPLLISAVQKPPITKLGVFEIDIFFPPEDRFKFALTLNGLLASPSFKSWLTGESLNISNLLYTSEGKTKHSIIYLAHLSDSEKMFFITLLLEQIVTWTRSQPGTTSLRALLYFDELFGFLPPVAEPPSKKPLLTLLKQARAFGLGLVLTTQNPMDIDYKAMSNAGTWFIGRLQTENDKKRLLDGLETITSKVNGFFNRAKMNDIISSLDSRVFLLHNIHSNETVVFQTRWVMSYLCGPLTRDQIRALTNGKKSVSKIEKTVAKNKHVLTSSLLTNNDWLSSRPLLKSGIKQVFLPVTISREEAIQKSKASNPIVSLVYEPVLIALAKVSYFNRKINFSKQKINSYLVFPNNQEIVLDWEEYQISPLNSNILTVNQEPNSFFLKAFPAEWSTKIKLKAVYKDFSNFLYYNSTIEIPINKPLKLYAEPNEQAEDFYIKCTTKTKEQRDADIELLREKTKKKLNRLEKKLAKEERKLEEDQNDYKSRKGEELLSAGESLVGLLGLFGSRRSTALSSAARKRRMTRRAKEDIEETKDDIEHLEMEIQELEDETKEKAEAIIKKWEDILEQNSFFEIKPRRSDVQIELVTPAWLPVYYLENSKNIITKIAAFSHESSND